MTITPIPHDEAGKEPAVGVNHNNSATDAGFTLLELLVAVALLAAITALLVGAITSARTAIETVERTNSQAAISGVRRFVADALSEARPLQTLTKERKRQPTFLGSTIRLRFVSSSERPGQFAGLYQYELFLQPRSGQSSGSDLVVRQRLWRPLQVAQTGRKNQAQLITLIAGVSNMSLRYYGALDGERAPRWHANWQGSAKLPLLVALDLDLSGEREDAWPRLVVKLQLAE